jgi:subtilisin family serine protease
MPRRRIDEHARKLHPRLRVLKNGDRIVNAVRSDGATTVVSSAPTTGTNAIESAPLYTVSAGAVSLPRWTARVPARAGRLPAREKLARRPPADDVFVNVFIEFQADAPGSGESVQTAMARVEARIDGAVGDARRRLVAGATVPRQNLLAATVPLTLLDELERDPSVAFVHPAEPLKLDVPVTTGAARPVRKAVGRASVAGRGQGVLIGLIDVGGFDFAHPDFLDDRGETRFVAIWDQGGDFRPPPAARGFSYGAEFTADMLNLAIRAARRRGVPPATWLERQSQREPGSHGTHVASIAAGRTGVCPEARIAAVLIDVPQEADPVERRRMTFSDTSRIAHAVEYLLAVARELDLPIAINISLGTNGGGHDGANGVSRWLDAAMAAPGRALCVAAGNAGQHAAETADDFGWMMGRIHTSGRVPARGLEVELEWTVVGDGLEDVSENELEIWYGAQDRFSVSVQPPGSAEWMTVGPRQFVENRRLPSGTTVSIYNELYHPTNGENYIAIYLSPNLDPDAFRGIDAGVWRIRLVGEEVRDGRFHAWIERDDPIEIGSVGARRLFRFPSFFSAASTVDSHSISSLACGHRVIAVANLDDARERAHPTSSQGPTRDGRSKPEIAAPGTAVVAANGFGDPDEPWIAMTGTSMASPCVTGVVGLMLSANRTLTAAQCAGILLRTARPLPGASYAWTSDVGYGRIDPVAAVIEAKTSQERVEVGARPRRRRAGP